MAYSSEQKQVILVVEDETLIRLNAADMIRDMGFEVVEAADADQAISLLESMPEITVVFTDIQMPGSMDGLRLVEMVRKRWPPVALLVTSGRFRPRADELPDNTHFLPKPYMLRELESHLHALTH